MKLPKRETEKPFPSIVTVNRAWTYRLYKLFVRTSSVLVN